MKTFEEIKKFCIEQRKKGVKIADIVEDLYGMNIEDWDYVRVRNAARVSLNPDIPHKPRKICGSTGRAVKEGAVERKPKVEQTESGYIVRYGKNQQVTATKEQIEKAFQLYCLANMTMNGVALECGFSRQEFYALKTAFEVTKDSIPLLPETIDQLSVEEVAERIRIAKKKFAVAKIHENKIKDIERDNKKFQDRNYLFSLAAERINAIDCSPFKPAKVRQGEEQYLLAISDIHAGMQINNRFSKYNLDIMRERFEAMTAEVLRLVKPCVITIIDFGDLVSGGIHSSVVKNSVNPVDSLFAVTECYLKLFTTLMSKGFKVRFASVGGNHDSIVAEKSARVNAESYARLFDWALRLKLADCKSIEFIDNDNAMALIPFFDYNVLALHGVSRKLSRFERLYPQEKIIEVLAGHLHNYSAQTEDNLPVYRLNSFCSADEYALNLGLSSESGARLITYSAQGRVCDRFIRL